VLSVQTRLRLVSCLEPVLNRLRTCSELITACLYEGCLNWSYFLDDGLDIQYDTGTPASPASNHASKKGSKKSSSKTTKKKAAKESSGGPAEDAETVNE
jgi:hypothetical protein